MQLPYNLAGGSPALFQFDIDEPPAAKFRDWVEERFLAFCEEYNLADLPFTSDKVFASGLKFQYQVMLWYEPGYFLNYDVTITFEKVDLARRKGVSIAPFQIKASTTFEFPMTVERNFVQTFRYQNYEELPAILHAISTSLNLVAMAVFMSEIITQ